MGLPEILILLVIVAVPVVGVLAVVKVLRREIGSRGDDPRDGDA